MFYSLKPPCYGTVGPYTPPRKSGVLLLVVLSMLTLFMLLGVTYLVLAARVRATSRAFLKYAQDEAEGNVVVAPLLRSAAMQVIRGTQNSCSVIRGHDLLGDKYGNSQRKTVVPLEMQANGQLLRLWVQANLDFIVGLKAGRVMTFLDDAPPALRNTSARIVATDESGYHWIEVPPGVPSATVISGTWSVLINDRDFSGPGFGYPNENTPYYPGKTLLNASALLPNAAIPADIAYPQNLSGANEDYDAIDEQNWALGTLGGDMKAQSFVRKNVVDYWIDRSGLSGNALINQLRRATFRPFPFDHSQDNGSGVDFSGAPVTLQAVASPRGDVDNDGDGTFDSVWLDLGESVFQLADGTAVKPLFAIHCVDLDGRLNINSHGSVAHLAESPVVTDSRLAANRGATTGAAKTPPSYLRGGSGYGPADVRLDSLLPPSVMQALMIGDSSAAGTSDGVRRELGTVYGRYGDGIGTPTSPSLPGQPGVNDRRPRNADLSLMASWTDRGVPENYWQVDGSPSAFGGNPPDFWSRFSVGVDHRGHPVYVLRNSALSVSETTDNAYELDLAARKSGNGYMGSSRAWVDQPFSAAELEAVLRAYDSDNADALPPRLLAMVVANDQLSLTRKTITTDSWDTPAVIAYDDVKYALNRSLHDPDLVDGLKMDLNRPFGDGTDNDGNGLVDETGETGDPYSGAYQDRDGYERSLLTRLAPTPNSPAWPLLIPQQPGPDDPHLRARQVFAWHLYNLFSTLKNTFTVGTVRFFAVANTGTPKDQALTIPSDKDRHNEKVLAQWAVNIVDFLDADAIMTPFRYHLFLTSGVVWGCESPDLMISETLAFHDRRTADTKCDPTKETTQDFREQYTAKYNAWMTWKNGGRVGPEPAYPQPTNPDGTQTADDLDFDQVRIPEGSLFIELHGTRNGNAPHLPKELYSLVDGKWALDLGRTPAANTPPVWRLSISTNRTANPSNDVFAKLSSNPDTQWLSPGRNVGQVADVIDVDRYVWLSTTGSSSAALPATGTGPTRNNTFYVQAAAALANPRILPGGYLVVGPRPTTSIGSLRNAVGNQKRGVPAKQRIDLKPSGGVDPAVGVYDLNGEFNPTVQRPNNALFGNDLPPPSERPDVAATWVSMDPPTTGTWTSWGAGWNGIGKTGIGLSVSEPLRNAYYRCPTTHNSKTGLYDAYGALNDDTHTDFPGTPLDQAGPLASNLLSGGTYANFCTVFVERLADPTRPHDPNPDNKTWNPYIVVDFMPVDLTVFNGESADRDPSETQGRDRGLAAAIPHAPPFPVSPADPLPPSNVPLPLGSEAQLAVRQTYFHTRQRGFGEDLPNYDNEQTRFGTGGGQLYRNPHPFKPIGSLLDIKDTPLATNASDSRALPGGRPTTERDNTQLDPDEAAFFSHELGQSPAARDPGASPPWNTVPYQSLGWVNPSYGRRLGSKDNVPAGYQGAPDKPFPWIVWNDRPFANPYELLLVPRTPPGRLFTNYRNLDYPAGYANVGSQSYNADDLFGACTPGAHLMPVTSITDVSGTPDKRTYAANFLSRVFEYVRVRSPFTGTEKPLSGLGGDGRPDRFAGPFNRIPTYREPGKVNINTIPYSSDPTAARKIWTALCGVETGSASPDFDAIMSRRDIPAGPSGYPYTRPYRAARGDSYSNSPFIPQPWIDGDTYNNAGEPWDQWWTPRAFTLLGDVPATAQSVFPPPPADGWANDGQRSAWFRFESLIRANANTTVRSEVYAIWVTMGLFDVQQVGADATRYPDGYRLVREHGSDTGDVTRHRAFYIFDRSIPVGYEQGVDHNVQDAILVERFMD